MNAHETQRLLKGLKQCHSATFSPHRPKKRKNESDRDFVLRVNRYRCRYTNQVLPKEKLAMIWLYPNRFDIPKYKNLGCASREMAALKGDMDDDEFRRFLPLWKKEQKQKVREEMSQLNREIKEAVFERYQNKCIYCEYEYGYTPKNRVLTIDHKKPVSKGGSNDLDRNMKNLALACKEHNQDKGSMTASEYFDVLADRKKAHAQQLILLHKLERQQCSHTEEPHRLPPLRQTV